jgi:hypothetical protein
MFSDEGRTLDEETLEYAWLVEVQLGKLGGKVTAPQVKLLNGCEPEPAGLALAHIHRLQQTCSTRSFEGNTLPAAQCYVACGDI